VRLLIDTNLLVSAILNAGLPRQLLTAARAGRFDLCTSEHLLDELYRVLGYAKLASRLNQANVTALDVVTQLRTLATVVTPAHVPRVVRTDPDDDHVLAAALQARADLIVTGDTRDLLPLGRYEGIFIVTARQAWDRLALQVN
jgi:putative PIN family toxin of toxin-antitoxin system